MTSLQEWAYQYRQSGCAVARLRPSEKRPTYPRWNRYSYEPSWFSPTDNIGLQNGALSGNLVNIDIDAMDVLAVADKWLPETGWVDERKSKPKSHRYFRVTNIPDKLRAGPNVAGGIGGPRSRLFFREPGKPGTLIEFRGTGLHTVVPPSLHHSGERRIWHSFKEPTTIDCMELFQAVVRLAKEFGWQDRRGPDRLRRKSAVAALPCPPLPIPTGETVQLARAYLAKMDPAIEGQGGDRQTFRAAMSLIIGFGLRKRQALPLLAEYSARCLPPWTLPELEHKLEEADKLDLPRGGKLRRRSRRATVNIHPDDVVVYVGPDADLADCSNIDLYPSMWAGLVRDGRDYRLAPELDNVAWEGKAVIMVPPSSVWTNQREVYAEYHLAHALRERGADVRSLHLCDYQGRRKAFSFDLEAVLIRPVETKREAYGEARKAAQRASELDGYRRSLPRQKRSLKLEKAIKFISAESVTTLSKEVLKKARRRGISKRTLQRAIKHKNTILTHT